MAHISFGNIGNAIVHLTKYGAAHEISYSLAGRLQLAQSGWLVIAVPAALVRGAFDALHEPGAELPKDYCVAIMTPSELAKIGGPDKVVERGHAFHYTLGPVRSSEPGDGVVSKNWYICIFSRELKRLRMSYKLNPYISTQMHFKLPIASRRVISRQEQEAKKAALYLADPDWDEFDYEAVKKAAEGTLGDDEDGIGSLFEDAREYRGNASGVKVPLPNTRQQTSYSCGPSVLAAIQGYFDEGSHNGDNKKLRSEVNAEPEKGTTPAKLVEAARNRGFKVELETESTVEKLKQYLNRDIPVVMAIQAYAPKDGKQNLDSGHYVAAIGWDDDGILFQDPAIVDSEARGFIPYDELEKRWVDKDKDGTVYNQLAIAIWKDEPKGFVSTSHKKVKIA